MAAVLTGSRHADAITGLADLTAGGQALE